MSNKVAENPFKNRIDEVKVERLIAKGEDAIGYSTSFIVITAFTLPAYQRGSLPRPSKDDSS